jgi:hypothetical protein
MSAQDVFEVLTQGFLHMDHPFSPGLQDHLTP